MTLVEQLAAFVTRAAYDDLSPEARAQLKIRVLDSLACAVGALIGGGRTAPDRAAFYNSALVRYLDFNDSFLARGETCHPSDNLGAVLAAAEHAVCSGRDLLTALAVAYQVQCRLSEVAPVRAKGFDHTTRRGCGCNLGKKASFAGRWPEAQARLKVVSVPRNGGDDKM